MIKLPRSSYYYRPVGNTSQAVKDADIRGRLEELALEFPRYGYRRMTAQLHQEGLRVNHKRVLRIMRQSQLLCKPKRRHVKTTESRHGLPVHPNLYRNQAPKGPDLVWVADVTYIRLPTEFVFLAVLLDAWSRKVTGWALSRRLDAQLTCEALKAAIASRRPSAGCIHHSDRGVEYACRAYVGALNEHGFQISMGRKGNPYDNAQAESFMKTLKVEEVYLWEYGTFEVARERIKEFIEDVYNRKRLHSALGYRSPVQFEQSITQTQDRLHHSSQICPT